MSSSVPSTFQLPRVLGAAGPYLGAPDDQVTFGLGEEPEKNNHYLGLKILPVLESDSLLDRLESHAFVNQGMYDSNTYRSLRPRQASILARTGSCRPITKNRNATLPANATGVAWERQVSTRS